MGAKGGGKVEVSEYSMSMHLGVCHAVDAFTSITIGEKLAWSGLQSTTGDVTITQPELFGGVKKEGGVGGVVRFLLGLPDQVLPNRLATRLGRASGATCPGFRGIASLFFTGTAANDASISINVWKDINYTNTTGAFTDAVPDLSTFALGDNISSLQAVGPWVVYEHANYAGVSAVVDGNLPDPFPNGHALHDKISSLAPLGYNGGTAGFYWTANNPYLKSLWVGVRRAPKGLNPAYAMIPRAAPVAPLGSFVELTWWQHSRLYDDPDKDHTKLGLEFFDSAGDEISGTSTFSGDLYCPVWAERTVSRAIPSGTATIRIIINMSPGSLSNVGGWVDDISLKIDGENRTVVNPGGETGSAVGWVSAGRQLTVRSAAPSPHSGAYYLATSGSEKVTAHQDHSLTAGADLDANGVHMIYECLTNRDWGMGAPTTMIDTAAFEAAGVVLYAEALGLSMLWTRQDTIENFVSEVIDHIQSTVFVNPRTGLITIKLIRGDYDPLTLRIITPDNADLTNFQRKAWGEIVNEVVVTWTNPVTEQDETVVAQDLGAIAAQNGSIISDNRNYYGVRSAAVATQLAARDLRSAAAPMATCEVTLDRTAWDLLPGEVVKLTWPEYGFDGVVMRVGAVDYGKPGEPLIRANLIEDIFGLAAGDYITPPVSQWQDVDAPPGPADFSRVITVPAFFAANFLAGAGDTSTFEYPEVIAGVLASDADAYNYDLFGPTVLVDGSTVQERQSTNTVLGRGTTVAALPLAASTSGVTIAGLIGAVDPAQTVFVLIGGDATAEDVMEIALITASAGGVHTLARGLLDTVPREWAAGTVIWLLDATSTISDLDPKADGETVTYRLLTRSFGGLLSYADAPVLSGTLSGRPHYPNRPANVTAHGAAWSSAAAIIDARARVNPWVTATWANRNRLMEDSQVLLWTGATVTPEVGQTTRIEVCTAGGTVLTTHASLTGTSFNVPDASFAGEAVVRLRIWAARTDSFGSFNSLQYFEHWVRVAPLRFDSTRVTFDSTLWTMDQG